MAWLNDDEGIPTGLSSWAAAFGSAREARFACERADWLFWLLLSAADSDLLRRNVVSAGVSAVELSPALRSGSARVAAAHIWSAPSPHDQPPRAFRASLIYSAAVATAVVGLGDLLVTSRLSIFRAQPAGIWIRATILLGTWCALVVAFDRWMERRSSSKLAAEVRAMTFERARSNILAELGRRPNDPQALAKLRHAEARWFQSTAQ